MRDYSDIMGEERPKSRRHPMEVAHRAKQFAPFAALKGYEESLKKQEESFLARCMAGEIGEGREEWLEDVDCERQDGNQTEYREESKGDFEVGF